MKSIQELTDLISAGGADSSLLEIYPQNKLEAQKSRYLELLERHRELFGDRSVMVVSTPGRTELGGNHTDHNHGNVLAGSVDLDSVCVVSASGDENVLVCSDGYEPIQQLLGDFEPRPAEKETTAALVRGILARFAALGYNTGGFCMNMNSEVLPGSGLSSSASVEVLIGTAVSELFNDGCTDFVEVARIGQFAENSYFGKACGLMDQVACAAGGVVGIDFLDPEAPVIKPVKYSFDEKGLDLMVTSVGSSHANLSDEYSAMPKEMRCAAAVLGAEVCRGITIQQLLENIPAVRKACGDRAVLRAFHFLNENERAAGQLEALEADALDRYLQLVRASGDSSFKYLQNIYLGTEPAEQGLSLALAFSEQFLAGEGACRVQGGGFAGTIQAYVPKKRVKGYIEIMESIFGEGCTHKLRIRNKPACRVL